MRRESKDKARESKHQVLPDVYEKADFIHLHKE